MAHGLDRSRPSDGGAPAGAAGSLARALAAINQLIVVRSSVALLVASFVLTYSVVVRYFLQDLDRLAGRDVGLPIVGAVFMSAAAIQARRGHVAIEAIVGAPAAAGEPRPADPGRHRELGVLRLISPGNRGSLLHEAIVDEFPFRLDLGAAALDSLFAHDRRHDAAQPCNCCCRSSMNCGRSRRQHDASCRSGCSTAPQRWW